MFGTSALNLSQIPISPPDVSDRRHAGSGQSKRPSIVLAPGSTEPVGSLPSGSYCAGCNHGTKIIDINHEPAWQGFVTVCRSRFQAHVFSKTLIQGGLECENWDIASGPQFDLADDAAWDKLLNRIKTREYAGAFASPPCTTCSRLRNKPGGPPPLRSADGPCRYGLVGLSIPNKERVRLHNLLYLRVYQILELFIDYCTPCIFEAPGLRDGKGSVLRLDEYAVLSQHAIAKHSPGVHCPFGPLSVKLTSWVTYKVDVAGMPDTCTHELVTWFNEMDGAAVSSAHRPRAGTGT